MKKNISFIILICLFFLAASNNDDSSELKVQISVLKNQSEETSKKLQAEVIIFKMCIYYYLKMNIFKKKKLGIFYTICGINNYCSGISNKIFSGMTN